MHLSLKNKTDEITAMEIKSLKGIDISSIVEAFNKSFSDYVIKLSFNEENFQRKIDAENIKLEYSPAAFVNGEIVGFILNGLDEINGVKTVFNGGTGVVPEHRGQRIVQKLYDYILPILKEEGYRHHQLEVFAGNDKAEKSYENVGFSRVKEIAAFKGTVAEYAADGIVLKEVKGIDWDVANSFFDIVPTWQNSTSSVLRAIDKLKIVVAYKDNNLAGYVVYDPIAKRIKQFAVKKEERNKGIGKTLFSYVNNAVGEVSFTNYDLSDTKAITFFKELGLNQYFESYEMKLLLK
ncbi:putative acetyltransferase [compost metagenome]